MSFGYGTGTATEFEELFSGSNYEGSGSETGALSGSAHGSSLDTPAIEQDFPYDNELDLLYLQNPHYTNLLPSTNTVQSNQLYPQSFDHYPTASNATSRASLSNASSPYSLPGSANTGNTSAFDGVLQSSNSPSLQDSNDRDNGVSISYNHHSRPSHYTNSTSSFQPGSHFNFASSKTAEVAHIPLAQYAPNFSTASLSPPESDSSHSSWNAANATRPQPGTLDNETLVRMIAEAQAQGQPNQAGYYPAPIQQDIKPRLIQQQMAPAYLANVNPMFQPQDPSIFSNYNPSSFATHAPNEYHDELDSKKRRTTTSPPATRATKASARKAAPRKSSSPQIVSPRVQQDLRMAPTHFRPSFDFSMQSTISTDQETMGMGTARSSVDLIANAGMRDSRQVYRAEPMIETVVPLKAAPARAAPEVKLSKAAEKKEKAAAKKGEKRKKGEKGHNAVERRYRNNINNHIATLRDIVPALRHLKPLPSMPASRRRASQFTLSTAAQAPTPAGLIDGIPAAKTLSKGTILGKAIEYIGYLQTAREYAREDILIFSELAREMYGGNAEALVNTFQQKRELLEVTREQDRIRVRKEQDAIDREAGSDVDELEDDEEAEPTQEEPQQVQSNSFSHLDGLAQIRHMSAGAMQNIHSAQLSALHNNSSSSGKFPPSPVSSSDDLSISPRSLLLQAQYRTQLNAGPPRVLLAAFMGVSFAGGLGYDWTVNNFAQDSGAESSGQAWTGTEKLLKRSSPSSGLIASDIVHPTVLNGLVFLGLATVFAAIVFLIYPLFARDSAELAAAEGKRCANRQKRRFDALSSLKSLNGSALADNVVTCEAEKQSALLARKELLKLVGAPTMGFFPLALAKEFLVTVLRKMTTIRVGSFPHWTETDQLEAAVAWVRIAEIEATVGRETVHFVSRCYTFFRLLNLSRSPSWPQSTSSTALPTVNAILAIHLSNLGEPLSAHNLWNAAVNADRKKMDIALDPWAEIALSTSFSRVKTILAQTRAPLEASERSDTLPLLRISESRCEAALRETWAKIFVAVAQMTCTSDETSFESVVDQDLLMETVEHVLRSMLEGSTVHTITSITHAVCCYYTGQQALATTTALRLAEEMKTQGSISRLGCTKPFFSLLLGESHSITADLPELEPSTDVDIIASTTLGWLTIKRKSQLSPSGRKVDARLHNNSLAIRRLLGSPVFHDPTLVEFCTVDETAKSSFDLESAQDACLEALTEVTRVSAGLKLSGAMDSGIDVSD